jgi:ribose 5-phosphate isomerase B
MRIAVGSDHVGFPVKASIVEALEGEEHAVLDLGVHSDDPVDYPAMIRAVATAVMKGFVDFGIFVCETSAGAAMGANKLPGIRAVACFETEGARESRTRLDANFLCLGGSEIDGDGAVALAREWLATSFSGDERDARMLASLDQATDGARPAARARPEERPMRPVTRAPAAPVAAPRAPAAPPPAPPRPSAAPPPAPPRPPAVPPAAAAQRPADGRTAHAEEPAPARPAEPAAAAMSSEPPVPVQVSPPSPPSDMVKVPDISAVLRFLATVSDSDIKLMAKRVVEVIRNRFPTAEGAPTSDGFTFTLGGKHVATAMIRKNHIELEIGPDRVATSRIRDLDGLDLALSLPSVAKGFDALRP